jgi:ABC-2 type transport system ATP-binding protein
VLGFDSATQGDEIRARTGALLEHPGLYERLTAEENLEFFGRIWRLSAEERAHRNRSLLQHLGLWDRRQERIGTWSRGMRQKLAIARTLLHHPPLVFLDEPTAGLDPVASASLRQDLAQLARADGVTVFLTTHNLSEAEKICDNVAVIFNGKLIAAGATDKLLAEAGTRRVTIRTSEPTSAARQSLGALPGVRDYTFSDGLLLAELDDATEPREIVALLVQHGSSVDEVRLERGSLEDAFLTLVSNQHAG